MPGVKPLHGLRLSFHARCRGGASCFGVGPRRTLWFKNWGTVLKRLAHIAETDYPKLEDRWKGDRQRFLDARRKAHSNQGRTPQSYDARPRDLYRRDG